jgi:hypothetical protein
VLSSTQGQREGVIDFGFCMLSSYVQVYNTCYSWHLRQNWGGSSVYAGCVSSQSSLPSNAWALQDSQQCAYLISLLKLSCCLSSAYNVFKSNTCLGFMARKSILACYFFPLLWRNTLGANLQCHLLSSHVTEELRFSEKTKCLTDIEP